MKRTKFLKSGLAALTLVSVLSFTGCSKSDNGPVYKDGCFKYADKTYNSLNAAIKAALDNQDDAEGIISLLDDVLDNEPLSIGNDEYGKVTFNLGGHTYVSAGGLDFKEVKFHLTGDGRFECRSGALSSSSRIEVNEDFKGRISAPVTLDEAVMVVFSPVATVNISQLKFTGRGLFSMEVVSEKPASVVIDRLLASDDSKVCAIDGESVVIREGGEVHVHNYKVIADVPANCCNAGYKVYQCEVCKDDYLEFKEGKTGRCIAANLIHHVAVEPTDTLPGNYEYWECPDCGASYSDGEGGGSIIPIRLPKNYDLPLDVLFGCDEVVAEQNIAPLPFIFIAQMAARLLFELLNSTFNTSDDEVLKKLDELSKKIAELSEQVKDLRKAIDELYRQVQNITLGKALSDYSKDIATLSNITSKYYLQYEEYLKDASLSPQKKRQLINEMLSSFYIEMVSNQLDAKLLTLLKTYCENSSIEMVQYKNIPDAQAKFTRNIYLWEHQGYTLRSSINLAEFHRLASSYVIINLCLNWSDRPENKMRMKELKDQLTKCQEIWQTDVKDMRVRDSTYRIYCGGKPGELVFYENKYEMLGTKIQDWFDNRNNLNTYYFPRAGEQSGTAIASCEKILADVGLAGGFIEHSHLLNTYLKYGANIKENKTNEVMQFIGFPPMPALPPYLICERTGDECYKYGHINGSINYPHYKIFQWYKWIGVRGWFKIGPFIHKVQSPMHLLDWWWLRENVDMWTYNGKIDDPGTKEGYGYYTIKKVPNMK